MSDDSEMADERKVGLDERFIPYWVVAEAVGKAIGTDVRGIERRGQEFAVLVDTEVSEE